MCRSTCTWLTLGLVLSVGGCSDSPEETADTGIETSPAESSASASQGSSTDGDGTSTTDAPPAPTEPSSTEPTDDDGGGDGPIAFDLGGIPDIGEQEEFGCNGVDFLFVIDNSGSMSAQQERLLASFPGFITAIENSLQNVDSYHVGVVTSDNYGGNEPGCQSIGDLVTQTSGFGSSATTCGPFASGQRFATDEDDLQSVFPCMAQVGTSGSGIEQPVTATVAALDPAKAMPGACNEGFVREDSILVVVIVTDDPPYTFDMDDAHPNTDTSGWYDAVVQDKGGHVESVVMIGFIPWGDVSCNGNLESPNLIGFLASFADQGVIASVCEDDYGPVFTSTVETIQTTCDNFVPQG